MPIYEVRYRKKCEHIMRVEANSEEEARQKYENFDCIEDWESQGIEEELIEIKLK